MTSPEFKVWLADGSEENADDVLGCIDAEMAAQSYVEDLVYSPDWSEHIDGEPIVVQVRDPAGVLTKWSARAVSSIDVHADEIEESDDANTTGGAR